MPGEMLDFSYFTAPFMAEAIYAERRLRVCDLSADRRPRLSRSCIQIAGSR